MNNPKVRRLVTLVDEQPQNVGKSKARLFAFGLQAIAQLTRQSFYTVQRHAKAGKFDPENLESVTVYCIDRRIETFLGERKAARTSHQFGQPTSPTPSP